MKKNRKKLPKPLYLRPKAQALCILSILATTSWTEEQWKAVLADGMFKDRDDLERVLTNLDNRWSDLKSDTYIKLARRTLK